MVTIITVCVVIVTLIVVGEMFAGLGHHDDYSESYHEKLTKLSYRARRNVRNWLISIFNSMETPQ